MLRRVVHQHPVDAMGQLTAKLAKFKSNQDFIELISGAHGQLTEAAQGPGRERKMTGTLCVTTMQAWRTSPFRIL